MISGSGEEVENVKTYVWNHKFGMNVGGATKTLEAQTDNMTNIYT